MERSLGMIECETVSAGIQAADLMSKTAEIELLQAKTVFPGKYIILFAGEIAAVKAAADAAKRQFAPRIAGSFILGNPHNDVFCALNDKISVEKMSAIGLIETTNLTSCVVAADNAAKSAIVKLIEIKLSEEMCGKAYVMFAGSTASVDEAVMSACARLTAEGTLLDFAVISAPDEKLWAKL